MSEEQIARAELAERLTKIATYVEIAGNVYDGKLLALDLRRAATALSPARGDAPSEDSPMNDKALQDAKALLFERMMQINRRLAGASSTPDAVQREALPWVQQAREHKRYREALEKIAKYDSGPRHSNTSADTLAQIARAALREEGASSAPRRYREALKAAQIALNDWLVTYAEDNCSDAAREETGKRIAQLGTIGYIASVQEQISAALREGG